MHCWLKNLAVSAFVILASISASHADDDRVDAFPYSNLKILPHWMIGCDNLEECSAVGYPLPATKDGDSLEQPWYITAKWKKDSDIISFFFSDYLNPGENPNDISARLCDSSKQCRIIDAGDKLKISAHKAGIPGMTINVQFILDAKKLNADSYIIADDDKNNPIYFNELLQNKDSININYLLQLGGKEKIYKMSDGGGAIAAKDLKKIYPEYEPDDTCQDPGNNSAFKYENGDSFLFIFCNEVNRNNYGVTVAKYNGKIYKNFKVADDATYDVAGSGIAWDNMFGGEDYEDDSSDDDDNGIFQISNIRAGERFHCNRLYDFAYNGKKFIIEAIRYMPICMNVDPKDWPIVYQRPQ